MGTAIASILAYALRWGADLFDGENSAQMISAKKAANQQALVDKVNADVAKADADAIRKDIAG